MTASSGFKSQYWLTYKQALDHGGVVRKGETGLPVVYWLKGTKKKKDNDEKGFMIPMYSTVFNLEQIEGMETVKSLAAKRRQDRIDFKPIEACEQIVAGFKNRPEIRHKEQRGYYSAGPDYVNMPARNSFKTETSYYAVLFHELTHSTGHASRLERDSMKKHNPFGSHEYSKEELVAEMGAAFLCAKAGIDASEIEQSAAYIKSWLKVLKDDPKFVLNAASLAQKAADHILGVIVETAETVKQ